MGAHATATVCRSGQVLELVLLFEAYWVPWNQLMWLGSASKHLYPFSHLARSVTYFETGSNVSQVDLERLLYRLGDDFELDPSVSTS